MSVWSNFTQSLAQDLDAENYGIIVYKVAYEFGLPTESDFFAKAKEDASYDQFGIKLDPSTIKADISEKELKQINDAELKSELKEWIPKKIVDELITYLNKYFEQDLSRELKKDKARKINALVLQPLFEVINKARFKVHEDQFINKKARAIVDFENQVNRKLGLPAKRLDPSVATQGFLTEDQSPFANENRKQKRFAPKGFGRR